MMRKTMRKVITASILAFSLGVYAEPRFPYAVESLIGDAPYTIPLPANPQVHGAITVDVYTDIRLPAGTYYLTLQLWDAELTRALTATDLNFGRNATPQVTPAFKGYATDNSAVFIVELADDQPRGWNIWIRLSGIVAAPDRMPRQYPSNVYIYNRYADANAAALADTPADAPAALFRSVHRGSDKTLLFEVASKAMRPSVTAHLATANVTASGGPFTGFEPNDETGTTEDTGVLATVKLPQRSEPLLDARDGTLFDDNVYEGVAVSVMADAGSFGFGTGTGDRERGIDPEDADAEPLAPTAFNIADDVTDCAGGSPLMLTVDGKAIDPARSSDPTYAADANGGHATFTLTETALVGDGQGPSFFLCVNTAGNTTAIPAIGDAMQLDGYRVTATALLDLPDATAAVEGLRTSDNGGAIDRNGTSVNVTYLSLQESHNQRLVIVNRCPCEAEYWMDSFQTEENTRVFGRVQGTIGPRSRLSIRLRDMLDYNRGGMPRASGILNLTVSESEVDIMTVQEHASGGIDTTIYHIGSEADG